MGDFEVRTPVRMESSLKYHPEYDLALTLTLESGQRTVSVGQFDWGGLLNLGHVNGNVDNALGYMLETPFLRLLILTLRYESNR